MVFLTISIITLIFYILLFLILYSILKSILKSILSIIIISILVFGVFGIILNKDIKNIKEKLPQSKNLILLNDNGKAITALKIISLENQNIEILNQEEIEDLNNKKYSNILLDLDIYKIISINIDFIDNSKIEDIEINNILINKENLIYILKSDDAFTEAENRLNLPINLKGIVLDNKITLEDQAQLKGILLSSALEPIAKDIDYIISQYKVGNLNIYKETIVFKMIKLLPIDTITNIISRN